MKSLRLVVTSALLVLCGFLLSGCPGRVAAREAGERVVTGSAREGAERIIGGAAREGGERVMREGVEQAPRVVVSAIEVNTSIKESAETAATRRLREIEERAKLEAQVQEEVVEILCDSGNFEAVLSDVYDAAYNAAYEQGLEWASTGIPVSEEQVKQLAVTASSEVISYYCEDFLNGRG